MTRWIGKSRTRIALVQASAVVVTEARPLARELVGRGRHPLALDARKRRVGVAAVRDVARVEARNVARVAVIPGDRGAQTQLRVVCRAQSGRRPAAGSRNHVAA
jgi:hypothetical protein